MKVNMEAIKTTAFALKYRLKGYKLLQNPKGSDPNEVVMMRNWFGFEPTYYDKHYHYERIRRTKKDGKIVKEEALLLTEYFMDSETKTYSGKRKNLNGYIIKDREFKKINKTNVSQNDLFERKLPVWSNDNEEYDFGERLFEQNRKKSSRPSFWQILKSNLNGGGMA